MLITLKSDQEFYLDGLIIENILSSFAARDLAVLSAVCSSLRAPAQLAARSTLISLAKRMQATLLRQCERGSWIAQLREWEALEATNLIWLQAEEKHTTLVKQGGPDDRFEGLSLVKRAEDLSGHGHYASMHNRMPAFRPDAINGHACFEFDGASVLKTKQFAQTLPQPITIMVVAKARGDTTIFDSLTPQYAPRAPFLFTRVPGLRACGVLLFACMPDTLFPAPLSQIGSLRAVPRLPDRLAPVPRDLHDRKRPGLCSTPLAPRLDTRHRPVAYLHSHLQPPQIGDLC